MCRKWGLYGLILVIQFVLNGCDSGTAIEKNEALTAVKNYNTMIQMAYLQADLNVMTNFATEKQIKMLFPTIQALQATSNSMRAEQRSFKVGRVSVKGDRAFVTTEETWVYWWQSMETGYITKPEETLTYKIKFNLVKDKGKWKVDSLEES